MKMKLTLMAHDGGPFSCIPAREVELEQERILCNDVTFPWDYNPHHVCLWVVGNEFGVLGAAWGNKQDALDEMADGDLLTSMAVDEEDAHEEGSEYTSLGNAGGPYDLTYAWMQRVDLSKMAVADLCKLAECRGAGQTTVYS